MCDPVYTAVDPTEPVLPGHIGVVTGSRAFACRYLTEATNDVPHLAELIAEVGEPSTHEMARAEAIARRIREHHTERAS